MAVYRITGIWEDSSGVITHYAIHEMIDLQKDIATMYKKTSKADAIKLVKKDENTVTTWLWSYTACKWKIGEHVRVVGSGSDKYLRTDPDSSLTDNLNHLINYKWFTPQV
jgi:hypothetical protein